MLGSIYMLIPQLETVWYDDDDDDDIYLCNDAINNFVSGDIVVEYNMIWLTGIDLISAVHLQGDLYYGLDRATVTWFKQNPLH